MNRLKRFSGLLWLATGLIIGGLWGLRQNLPGPLQGWRIQGWRGFSKTSETVKALLSEYPELQISAQGTVQPRQETVSLSIHVQSPDPSASNAFVADGHLHGPWQNPTFVVDSLKKKNFKARIRI